MYCIAVLPSTMHNLDAKQTHAGEWSIPNATVFVPAHVDDEHDEGKQ